MKSRLVHGIVGTMLLVLSFPAFAATSFVLPWNDTKTGVTDCSQLNTPITNDANRVTVDGNGHFVANGARVRFLGFNFAGDSPFSPTNKSDAMAGRLAKFGINAVRFHHMDASWATGGGLLLYNSSNSTNLNSSQLDRVHYMVSRLNAHGIYSDINLLVGREYRPQDGLGTNIGLLDWKTQHILGFFNDTALALHKDYASKVLTPTNRYTGLPLAKDPGVAFVEIINENGILAKWLDGGLDTLPPVYNGQLQAHWNAWLSANYTNDAALLAAWKATNQALGTNMLRNGAFTNGLSNWVGEQHDTAKASFTVASVFTNNRPAAVINVTNADPVSWHIQVNQGSLTVSAGQPYTLSYWARAAQPMSMDVSVMRNHDDYAGAGFSQSVHLTTNWQYFSNTFPALFSDTNVRVNFGGLAASLCTVYIADVRMQAGGQLGLPPEGASLTNQTIPIIAHTATNFVPTAQARSDWVRFMRDLECRYYDQMVTHLRSNIGYSGLIFGTIMANSPATVQSRMDVIDAHAYWMHPSFPGVAWDSVNWYQPNVSMVNTVGDDNTLTGLARQRIKGKPFTVTEYQHPSPNYYGCEGPLLLAAYAGLQDWDGLWMFDYGPGCDVATMGYVRSYFDTAQHPGKMANLLMAANLFRRGDVSQAVREYTMAMTPDKELGLLSSSASAWSVFTSGQMGLSGKFALMNRINTSVGTNAAGLTTPPVAPAASDLASDTGELRWNAATANRGVVTVNTHLTKAVVGYSDNTSYALGELTVRPGKTQLGWSSISATLKRGTSFTNDCTALLVASGWWENTGQVWTSTNSIGNHWGGPPVLVEVVPFTLTLPVGTNRVQVWALDTQGQRKSAIPVSGTGQSTTISIGANSGSIWYELQVQPQLTGFQLWQQQYFSSAQLTNTTVSGPLAAPAGDGLPNLWKYYMGVSAWSPAGGQGPSAATWLTGGQLHLAMSFLHDKAVGDIICTPEVCSGLQGWPWDSAQAIVGETNDMGSSERITVYDMTPMNAASQRFMRLRLDPLTQ